MRVYRYIFARIVVSRPISGPAGAHPGYCEIAEADPADAYGPVSGHPANSSRDHARTQPVLRGNRLRNSRRSAESCRKEPRMALFNIFEPSSLTPRQCMQK